jgi:hypothetical protein
MADPPQGDAPGVALRDDATSASSPSARGVSWHQQSTQDGQSARDSTSLAAIGALYEAAAAAAGSGSLRASESSPASLAMSGPGTVASGLDSPSALNLTKRKRSLHDRTMSMVSLILNDKHKLWWHRPQVRGRVCARQADGMRLRAASARLAQEGHGATGKLATRPGAWADGGPDRSTRLR